MNTTKHLKHLSHSLLLSTLILTSTPPLHAQSTDSATQAYIEVYHLTNQADDQEERGNYSAALSSYQVALDQLEDIMRRHPEERAQLYRRKREQLRRAINRTRPLAERDSQSPNYHTPNRPYPPAHNTPSSPHIERIQQQLAEVRQDRDRLLSIIDRDRANYQEQLRQARLETAEAIARQNDLRDALLEARQNQGQLNQSSAAQIQDLNSQIETLNQELQTSRQRSTELERQLAEANSTIEEMSDREAELIAERDRLIERQELLASDQATSILAEENHRLGEEMADLQSRFNQLQEQNKGQETEIAQLKQQVIRLQNEVDILTTQNDNQRQRLSSLERQIKDSEQLLETALSETDREIAVQENRLLRTELTRLMQEQRHRELMAETFVEQLQELGAEGEEMVAMIDQMATSNDALGSNNNIDSILENASAGIIAEGGGTQDSLAENAEAIQGIQELITTARQNFNQGNYERALTSYDIILNIVPNDFPALVSRGVVLLRLERFSEAEDSLKKALTHRTNNSYARTMHALALWQQDRPDRAIEELELAIRFEPSDPLPHFYRGLIAQTQQDYFTAEAQYTEAITLDNSFADAHFNLASLLCQTDPDNRSAIERHYTTALDNGAPRDTSIENTYMR